MYLKRFLTLAGFIGLASTFGTLIIVCILWKLCLAACRKRSSSSSSTASPKEVHIQVDHATQQPIAAAPGSSRPPTAAPTAPPAVSSPGPIPAAPNYPVLLACWRILTAPIVLLGAAIVAARRNRSPNASPLPHTMPRIAVPSPSSKLLSLPPFHFSCLSPATPIALRFILYDPCGLFSSSMLF